MNYFPRRTPVSAPARRLTTLSAVSLMLGSALAAAADTTYQIQPIAVTGEKIGDLKIAAGADFEIAGVNDNGQIAFVTENAAGGEMLIQYADGKLIPIVAGGKDAPGGTWTKNSGFPGGPVNMNQQGNIVFGTEVTVGGKKTPGAFLWEYQKQHVTALALQGMPAIDNRIFQTAGGSGSSLNNQNEIALVAQISDNRQGVFFRGQDGMLQPVVLGGDLLSTGRKATTALVTSFTDDGAVGAVVTDSGGHTSAYRWEKGTLSLVAAAGADAPGGGKFTDIGAAWLNNRDRSVLVGASVREGTKTSSDLYRLIGDQFTAVLQPGQEMPGGGKFKTFPGPYLSNMVSRANDRGQHVLVADLQDGGRGIYRLEADGTLSLVLKKGASTDQGQVTGIDLSSFGLGLNNKGQVAAGIRFAGNSNDTLVLLSPVTP